MGLSDYAVVFGLDRLATDSDISELRGLGALGSAKKALTLHINMGPNRDVLAQASNIIAERLFRKAAKGEWASKGIAASERDIDLRKAILGDGGLFVVATVVL